MKKDMTIIFFIALIVRMIVFQGYLSKNQRYWQVDSSTYHKIAVNISQGKGISLPDGRYNFYRVPGYPCFLAICYSIFGENKVAAMWVQVFLAAFIPVLIYFLALLLFPNALALARVVAGASCFHLGFVLYSGFFMTESLFILCLLLCLYLLFKWQQLRGVGSKNLLLSGLLLGVASLIRPVGHYLVILLAIFIVLFSSAKSFSKRFAPAGTFIVAWGIPVSFWLIRNYLLLGYFFFHTLPGGHFLHLSAARVAMHTQNTSYQQARKTLQKEVDDLIIRQEAEQDKKLNEIERCYAHEQIAKKHFLSRPLIAVRNWITDIMRATLSLYSAELLYLENGRKEYDYFKKGRSYWSLFERYLFPQTHNTLLRALVYSEILVHLLVLLGFTGYFIRFLLQAVMCRKWFVYRFFIQILLLTCFFLVIALAGGYARMRLPVEAFLLIYASVFWIQFFTLKSNQKTDFSQ